MQAVSRLHAGVHWTVIGLKSCLQCPACAHRQGVRTSCGWSSYCWARLSRGHYVRNSYLGTSHGATPPRSHCQGASVLNLFLSFSPLNLSDQHLLHFSSLHSNKSQSPSITKMYHWSLLLSPLYQCTEYQWTYVHVCIRTYTVLGHSIQTNATLESTNMYYHVVFHGLGSWSCVGSQGTAPVGFHVCCRGQLEGVKHGCHLGPFDQDGQPDLLR